MSKSILLSLSEYPQLKNMSVGKVVTIRMKARIGFKKDGNVSLVPDSIEINQDGRSSPSEILLASIDESLNKQVIAKP